MSSARDILAKISKNKKTIIFVVLFCCVLGLGAANPANAALDSVAKAIVSVLGWIIYFFAYVIGLLLTFVIKVLIDVAGYNDFINVEAVKQGWVIVRDLCNMFFVLVILVIAFATILKYENYHVKKLLPKLLIMAVLINFSKTICGLIIDFAQVIMLTFVNGFGQYGENNLVELFQIKKFLAFSGSSEEAKAIGAWETAGAILAGFFALVVTLIVVLILLFVLVFRVIMLWVYVILSPLAFILSAFPAGARYAQQWWGEFSKQVIVGPILAFFIWLALTTAHQSGEFLSGKYTKGDAGGTKYDLCAGENSLFCGDSFQTYIITIALLIGGLIVTQQLGGMAGAAAGKGIGWIRGGAALGGKGLWGATKMGADWINRKQATGFEIGGKKIPGTSFDLNPFRQVARIKAGLERGKTRDLSDMELKAGEQLRKGGMRGAIRGFTAMGWADHHVRGFLGYKGIKSALKGGEKRVEELREEEAEARWRSKHVFADQGEFDQKKQEYLQKASEAKTYGNMNEYNDRMKDVSKMDELGNELIVGADVEKTRKSFLEETDKKAKQAAEYTVIDYEGIKARRIAENEEASKITSSNEDELIAQFDSALAHNNTSLAGALARRIAQIGGFNALLNKHGYQATAGLNEAEIKKLKDAGRESEIMEKRGLNDFMRDVFEKRLGMDRQNTLTLQSDLGGIGEGINHEYLIKTVGVDKAGKFYQTDQDSRALNINIEKSKMEREGVIRKGNRLNYGAEDLATGKFKWTASGLTEFVNNWKLVGKEIKGARFNRSTAASITEPEALKILEKVMKKAEQKGVLGEGHEDMKTVDEFIKKLKLYALSSGEEGVKKLGKTIKDELD